MSWVRIDDQFGTHYKFRETSSQAIKFYIAALCYCARHLTDGQIDVKRVPHDSDTVRYTKVTQELHEAGLLDQLADGSFWVHDYLQYNPSRENVLAGRKADAERQARHRANASHAVSHGVSHGVTGNDVTPLVTPSRPVPLNTYARASQRRAQPVDKPTPVPPPFVDDGNTGIPCPPDLRAQMGLDA